MVYVVFVHCEKKMMTGQEVEVLNLWVMKVLLPPWLKRVVVVVVVVVEVENNE